MKRDVAMVKVLFLIVDAGFAVKVLVTQAVLAHVGVAGVGFGAIVDLS